MTIQFKKATRQAVRLKIGIDGPSGSGKTFGALSLATGITNGGKIALADSENESASFYADAFEFDTVPVTDAEPATMAAIINAAVEAEYDALVIDSLSHVWMKILADKDEYDRANPKSNQWTNWGIFGGKWERLMKHILDAPIHVIATMRSKQAYEQTERDGKKRIVKLGLQPQVRDGAEYEFGLVFSVNDAHRAEATKDRTRMFAAGELLDLADAKLHKRLVNWMNSETPATMEAVVALTELTKHPSVTDVTRRAVLQLVGTGTPGAHKVAKWTEQLEKHIREAERSAPSVGNAKANPEHNGSGHTTPADGGLALATRELDLEPAGRSRTAKRGA